MYDFLINFGLSYAPPDPGCEYEFAPDPVWGEIPVGQICDEGNSQYVVIGVVVAIIISAIVFYMVRRKKKLAK